MDAVNMQSSDIWQRVKPLLGAVAPWVVGVLTFMFVSYQFFAPQFEGKSLAQGDIAQYAGMYEDIKQHRLKTGDDPQWTGNMFGGMPAYLIDVEYPTQYVKRAASPLIKAVGSPANMVVWAMVLMMVAVVLMGVNPWLGIIAGLAYGLSTYFFLIIDAGHITKMWALVYAPPLVGAVWYALRRNMWVGAALAALFGSLELGANHPQITYYFLLACLALWISQLCVAWREGALRGFAKRTAILAVAALLAVGSNIAPLWYTMEHQKYTTRVGSESVDEKRARESMIAYNTAWSYGIAESCNMLVPNYMGGSSSDVNMAAVELLQSQSAQMSIFNAAIDDKTKELSQEMPGIRRGDVVAMLEEGDEYVASEVEARFNARLDGAWSYISNYWGAQPYTAGPTYLGAVVVLLAILGLMLLGVREVAWLVVVSLFALLLAWGANIMGFYEVMFDLLPGYKSFRTVSMALVVIEWSAPLVAVMALWALLRSELSLRAQLLRIVVAFGIVVVAIVLMIATAGYGVENIVAELGDKLWVEQLRAAVLEARRDALMADAVRSLLFAAMAAAVMAVFVVLREREKGSAQGVKWLGVAMAAAIALLVVWDLGGVATRYMGEDRWHDAAPTELKPTEADRLIMADGDLGFRVLDLTGDPFTSARASYFHRSVGGYHGAKMGRYQDVIDEYLRRFDGDMLAALNTRYIIYDGDALPAAALTGVEPYGAAWFVDDVVRCATPREELEALAGASLRYTAVVNEGVEGVKESYDAVGDIALVEYAPNYLKYEYRAAAEALAVFSEIYFPEGWSAYVDGVAADYFAVDYVLRGMVLPAGSHTVEWRFEAPRWGAISAIMAISALAVLLAVVAALVLGRRLDKGNSKE
ncbi:MAG: hypothetical protein IKT66_07330 [Alistipes sp.]|nr:hypothetical protein [Alistipes sp.]